jgi:hypothetical protein
MVPYDRPIRLVAVLESSADIEVCTPGRFGHSDTYATDNIRHVSPTLTQIIAFDTVSIV